LEIPVADELLRYRKLEKIRNTYLRSLIKETCNGYLHPFLNLHGPRTFRSSSSNPNIQNQPTRDPEAGEVIRKAFRAREGHRLVAADYGGIEVKGSSWYHKDPTMLGYLNDPENADMHADFCKLLFRLESLDQSNKGEKTLRKATKNGFTFPQFYGDYYGNNAVSLWGWLGLRGHKISSKQGVKIRDDVPIGKHLRNKGIKNFEQFKEHVRKIEEDMWSNRFPVYKQWRDNQWEWYQENGYVTILSGFVCQGIMTRNAVINYPIQGVCFHCLLWSIIQINEIIKKENMRTKPIFQVHDEIVSDVPDDEYDEYVDILKEVMCKQLKKHWPWINTKLELEVERSDVGGNWHEMEKSLEYIH
jgi:DNA polymerase-1